MIELKNKKKSIIAVDFDGTLCEHDYPNIGFPNVELIEELKNLRELGHYVILWTCRNGIDLIEAIDWCKEQGLEFDSVNEDVPFVKDSYFGKAKSVKVLADVYVDDRAFKVVKTKRK